jgi:hypothetical protein
VLFEIDPEDYRLFLEKAKLIWPLWIDRLHKRRAPCSAWNRSYPNIYDRRKRR